MAETDDADAPLFRAGDRDRRRHRRVRSARYTVRRTTTIQKGAIGNEQPIKIVSEGLADAVTAVSNEWHDKGTPAHTFAPLFSYDNFRIDIYEAHRTQSGPMKDRRKPTDAELAILRVLWARGPSTVREVAEEMGREGAYTTVLKILQIMTEKRLVRRNDSSRTHVYEAMYSQGQTQKQIVTDLLDRVFDGSAAKLVLQALEAGKTSPEELAEIRRLIDKHPGGRR